MDANQRLRIIVKAEKINGTQTDWETVFAHVLDGAALIDSPDLGEVVADALIIGQRKLEELNKGEEA